MHRITETEKQAVYIGPRVESAGLLKPDYRRYHGVEVYVSSVSVQRRVWGATYAEYQEILYRIKKGQAIEIGSKITSKENHEISNVTFIPREVQIVERTYIGEENGK